MIIPIVYQMFGPVQADGGEENMYNTAYTFIGNALSANTKVFPFSMGLPFAVKATWRHIWTPNSNQTFVRLVHMDGGPTNITQIVEVQSGGTATPVVEIRDFTGAFNDLVTAKIDKQIGFQVKDNNTLTSTIYESRLEIWYKVGE